MKMRHQHNKNYQKKQLTDLNRSIINFRLLLKLMADEQREFACWQPLLRRLVLMVVLSIPASFLIAIPFGPVAGLAGLALLLPATLLNLMQSLKRQVLARCDNDEAFCRQAMESGLLTKKVLTNKSDNIVTDYSLASVPTLVRT